MMTAVLVTLIDDRFRMLKIGLSIGSTALLVVIALLLVVPTIQFGPSDTELIKAYPLGNWPMPFGIVPDILAGTLVCRRPAFCSYLPALADGAQWRLPHR
jgi:multicomponent K+:H+ antiporter subunit D